MTTDIERIVQNAYAEGANLSNMALRYGIEPMWNKSEARAALAALTAAASIPASRGVKPHVQVVVADRRGVEAEGCDRCQGNGEIVTDWERYLHGPLDENGNDAVAECPDCNGTGERPAPQPVQEQEPVAWASCPGCNGTGDQGGNPSYGACDDCGGTGKIGTVLP